MATNKTTCDVFIAHAPADSALANKLLDACKGDGLQPLSSENLAAEKKFVDKLRTAITESHAMVVILSQAEVTDRIYFAIGMARGANKPIFVVLADPNLPAIPPALANCKRFPADRIDDVIKAIKALKKGFTDEDRSVLVKSFIDMDIPFDKMAYDPEHLDDLEKRFITLIKKTGKKKAMGVSGEGLFSELVRMKKTGHLKEFTAKSRVKP